MNTFTRNEMETPRLDSLTELHCAFWNHELKAPIVNADCSFTRNFRHIPALPPQWADRDGLLLDPQMLSPDAFQPPPMPVDNPGNALLGKVAFNTLFPYPRVPWLVGIVGCGLAVSTRAETVWPVPYLPDDWYRRADHGLNPSQAWLDKLLEFLQHIVDNYYPEKCVPVQDMVVRGPGDLCINMMGPERFYYALYDHPAEIKSLLGQITEIYIHWATSQLERIPQIEGGYVNQYGMWCPGTCIRFQEDYAINLSPRLLRQFILPCSRKVVEAFNYSVIHTHSGDSNLAEAMLDLDSLNAIEVSLDPNGPPLEELVPLWNRVLEKKCLVICGPVTGAQLELLTSDLSPEGLWLDVEVVSDEGQTPMWEWDQTSARGAGA